MPIDTGELDNAIVELEEMFGGYVGKGTFADKIRWVIDNVKASRENAQQRNELLAGYQAEVVNICRELGFEPDVQVTTPEYYGDMISESIDNLKASQKGHEALDPKGRIVLETFEIPGHALPDALVFSPGAVQPYIVAHDYDAATGEWSHGSYFSEPGRAYEAANPEIIEDACVRWQLEDVRDTLMEAGVEPTVLNVREALHPDVGSPSLARSVREQMIERGWEVIEQTVGDLVSKGRLDDREEAVQEKPVSLDHEKRDMQAACGTQEHAAPSSHAGREDR